MSLGITVIHSGHGWSSSAPLCAVIIPTTREFEVGEVLEKIPGNAIPIEFFFPEATSSTEMADVHLVEKSSKNLIGFSAKRAALIAKLCQQPTSEDKVTLIEKSGGWTPEEIGLFVALGTECAQLPRLPNRIIVFKIIDTESIRELLGRDDVNSKHVTPDNKWN